jgi:hypothetical protein
MEVLKTCTKCKIEKPSDLKYFRKNKNLKSGLDSWCRDCACGECETKWGGTISN